MALPVLTERSYMSNAWSDRVAAIRLMFRATALMAGFYLLGATPPATGASVTLQWDRATSHTNLNAYIVKYGGSSLSHTGSVEVATNATTATINNLSIGRTYFFVVTARSTAGVESDPSNETSHTVPGTITNAVPVASAQSTTTPEDTARAITLAGSDLDGDPLTFTIVAQPSNGTLTGTPPNISYQPAANFSGTDTFTFRVNDGITNSLPATVTVTVNAQNDAPTLSAIANLTLQTNAAQQTVTLSGIGSGAANESQSLTVTASSSNTGLIPTPTVSYTSPGATGSLRFTPTANLGGSATITVTVNDSQTQNNTFSRSFVVTVGSAGGGILIEAENGTLAAPMSEQTDTNAFGGNYVTSDVDGEGTVTVSFSVATSDDYHVWCRVLSVDTETDSFYVGVNAGDEDTYPTSPNAWSPNWQWSRLTGTTAGGPRILPLSAGTHTISFRCRERTAGLDAIFITSDPNATPPAGGGGGSTPNRRPTLNTIANVTVDEDAAQQTINIAGITSGAANESQTLSVSATSSNPGLVPTPTIVYTSANTTGSLRFTPTANSNGTATITVTVDDGQSVSNTFSRSFNVTVSPLNDLPTLNAINNVTVGEDSGNRTVNLSGIASGAANESQTLFVTATSDNTALISTPTVAYSSPASTATLTFRPATNSTGTATITVNVNDGQTANNIFSRSFTVTVSATNDAPTISDVANQSVNESASTAAIAFTVADVETPAASLTVTGTSSNPALIPNTGIVIGGSGSGRTVTITPTPTRFGTATITLRVTDAGGLNATDTFTLTVNPVNQAPTLTALGNLTIAEDSAAQTVNLSGIGTGATNENDTLVVTATSSNPSLIPNPTVTYTSPNPTGSIRFTPVANASGSATITVTVNDGQAQNGTATRNFTVTVTNVNDLPTISNVGDQTVAESSSTAAIAFTVGDSETGAGTLTVTGSSSNPTLVPNTGITFGGNGASRTVRVTPAASRFGSATITITVADASGGTASDSFVLTVTPVNQPPTLNTLVNLTIAEDAAQQTVNLAGITSGNVNETDTLTVTATSSNPSLVPNPAVAYTSPNATGTLTFTPVANGNGTATITVAVNDGQATSNTVTRSFTVTVSPVNDAPALAGIGDFEITEDSGQRNVSLTGISSGATNESQTLVVTATSSTPSVIPNPTVTYTSPAGTGTLTLRSATNATGSAVITVTVSDGQGQNATVTRTFTVTVRGVNDAPIVSAIADQVLDENQATAALTFTVGDTETPAASLFVAATSSAPTLVPTNGIVFGGTGANRTVTVIPAANQFGSAVITVTVTDANNGTATELFTVAVNGINSPPTLDPLGNLTLNEDAPEQVVELSGISSGAPDELQILQVTATSSNPSLIPNPVVDYTNPNASGSLHFTPVANGSGTAVITVTVNDGQGRNATTNRTFTVTVVPVNDLPTISDVADQTVSEGTATATLSFSVGDVETAAGSLVVAANSSNPTLIPNASIVLGGSGASRTVRVTPAAGRFGSAAVTLTVTDASGGGDSDSFLVTVTPVNQAPTLNTIANLTIAEDAAEQAVNLTGISTGNANESDTLAITATSSDPALVPHPAVTYTSPNATGFITFTPAPNASGIATITVTVNDGQATSNTVTRAFAVTVNPLNDPPTLSTITDVEMTEDSAARSVVLTGISSGATNEAQALTVTAVSSTPSVVPHPTVTYTSPDSTGSLNIRNATNASGSAVITVTVSDGQSVNSTVLRSFTVNVSGVNDAPTLSSIINQTVDENEVVGPLAFNIGDTETPASSLVVAASSSNPTLVPANGIALAGSAASRTITVTPAANQSGSAVITLTVTDQNNGTATKTFTVTVRSVNQPPTLDPIAPVALNEDAPAQIIDLDGISTGAFNELQTLEVTAVSSNPSLIPNPTVTYTSPNFSGSLRFTPVVNASGTAVITVTVNDRQSQNNTVVQTFSVTVNPVNDAPVISGIADLSIDQDTFTAALSFTIGDAESPVAALSVGVNSSNPSLVPNANILLGGSSSNRTVQVTPLGGQSGSAIVTISVSDGTGGVNSESFILTVSTVNQPPTLDALNDMLVMEDSGTNVIELTGISSGAAGENQTLVVTATSSDTNLFAHPTISYASPAATGTLTFTPRSNTFGTATIVIEINDAQARNNISTRSFTVTVLPVNDVPTLDALDNLTLVENTPSRVVTLGGINPGATNEAQPLIVTATSSNPSLIPNPTVNYSSPGASGSITLLPTQEAIGTTTITVLVDDGEEENNLMVRTFTVTVVGTNSPPTITDLPDRSIPMNGIIYSIPFSVADLETPATGLRVLVHSSNQELVWTNNIIVNGTGPDRGTSIITSRGAHGYTVITYTVVDAEGASSSDSFILTVVPPNTQPTLDPIASRFIVEDSGPNIVDLTGISAGGDDENQMLIVSAVSMNPAVIPHPVVDYLSPNTSGTLTLTPASNVTGSATIVVTLSDGQSDNSRMVRMFGVSVTEENDPPEISAIPNQVVEKNTPTGNIPFIISDNETPASNLSLAASSSDQTIVPDANIHLAGTGANRTVTVTPAQGRSGVVAITIFASDNRSSSSTTFQLTVGNGNTPPAVQTPGVIAANSYTEAEIAFSVSDLETQPEELLITAASANPTVLPDENITISGSGSNRVMRCRPVAGKSGTVNINLGVSDGRATTRRNLQLNVAIGTAPSEPISIRRVGRGTVKPMLDGQLLTIGKAYTVTAIPDKDEVFVHWSRGATSTSPKLTFVMVSNLVLEVTFTNNPYIDGKGNYSGLFFESGEVQVHSSGSFLITTTDRGTYTGKLKVGATTYPLAGALDLSQKTTNSIPRKGTNNLQVELDFGSIENQVVGRVTDAEESWIAALAGDRQTFNTKSNPCPFAGNYTLVLPGQESAADGPQGDGYGTIKVDGNGLASLAGALADGTKFAAKTPLAANGQWPVHVSLAGNGSVLSWMNYTNRPADDITGRLSWIRPAQAKARYHAGGFTNETMALGSVFVRPASPLLPLLELGDTVLYLSGGNLSTVFTNNITWGEKNKITNRGTNKLTLTITASSGLFSGSFTDPTTGKASKFNGAILQKQNFGSGFLLGTNASSLVGFGDFRD